MTIEPMIEFHLEWTPGPRGRENKMQATGERVLMRISSILCLFPEHRQIRTIEQGWTVTVCEEDWAAVESAFRSASVQICPRPSA